MLTLLLLLTGAFAQEAEEGRDEKGGFLMNDVGAWLYLPAGWEADQWTDEDFKAKATDGSAEMKLWTTPYQLEVTMEGLQKWSAEYERRIEVLGGADRTVKQVALANFGDKKGGRVDVEFSIKEGRVKGYAYHAVIPSAGQMIHIRSLGAGRNARKAEAALIEMATQLKQEKAPLPVNTDMVTSEAGFAAKLPDGWRAPLDPELGAVRSFGELTGAKDLSKCWSAIRPVAIGEPDVLLACKKHVFLGPLDEHSWDGEMDEAKRAFLGGAEVPAPEKINVGDRLGYHFKAKDGAGALRLAVAPYDGGLVGIWGQAAQMSTEELEAAVKAAATATTFTGPNGGQPIISADKRVGYYLRYRTFSPIVLGPLLLLAGGIAGLVVWSKKRAENKYKDI